MKQLIVLSAVFVLLMAFLMQIPLEAVNYEKKEAIEYYVNNAKEKAKQEGCYTSEILSELTRNIADKMNVSAGTIIIDNSTTLYPNIKYRKNSFEKREEIYLKIHVPFDNIIAADTFFGLEDGGRYYTVETTTTSEKLSKQ